MSELEKGATTDQRPEVARLRAVIDGAVEELCFLAEEIQGREPELAARIWTLANERLEIPVQHD